MLQGFFVVLCFELRNGGDAFTSVVDVRVGGEFCDSVENVLCGLLRRLLCGGFLGHLGGGFVAHRCLVGAGNGMGVDEGCFDDVRCAAVVVQRQPELCPEVDAGTFERIRFCCLQRHVHRFALATLCRGADCGFCVCTQCLPEVVADGDGDGGLVADRPLLVVLLSGDEVNVGHDAVPVAEPEDAGHVCFDVPGFEVTEFRSGLGAGCYA